MARSPGEADQPVREVLDDGDLSAAVPACPAWTLADLGEHLRQVHTWAAHAVTEGNPEGTPPPGSLERTPLVAGYRSAARHLIDVLADTPPDAPAWTFGPEKVSQFWRRRQLHEVTVHLHDALAAEGRAAWSVTPELAWDGVDEVATVFYPRQVRLGRVQPLPGTLRLVATDLPDRSVEIATGDPAIEVAAPAAELLLTLWKRRPGPPEAAALLAEAITP